MSDLGPTDYKVQLGEVLAELRTRAGLERAAAEEALDCSLGKVKSFESGRTALRKAEIDVLLNLYGVDGDDRADIVALADAARQRRPRTTWGSAVPQRLRSFFHLEETATEIRVYDPELIYGLVQTEGYARAVIGANTAHSHQQVERLVQARMARKRRLDGPTPPRLVIVMSEAAIRIETPFPGMMQAQLRHLVELAARPNIDIRIATSAAGLFAARGFPFAIITRPGGQQRAVAFVEALSDALYFDDPGRIEIYESAWKQLLEASLTSEASRSLLDTVALQL